MRCLHGMLQRGSRSLILCLVRSMRVVVPVLLIGMLTSCSPCTDEIVQQLPAPGGSRTAVFLVRDCGATTDYASLVAIIRPGGKIPRKRGIVFSADTGHGSAVSQPNGALFIDVSWRDATHLHIAYDSRVRVFKHETQFEDIQIDYTQKT
jgi:hypothetical protein